MQLIPRYLVNNTIIIVTNETGFDTEYMPVYSRQIKAYRGIDNKIQFKIVNASKTNGYNRLYAYVCSV